MNDYPSSGYRLSQAPTPGQKRAAQVVMGAILVAVLLAAIGFFAGCASSNPPDRVALDSLQVMKATANAAMTTGNAMYVSGQLSAATAAQMVKDYDYFIAASTAATQVLGVLAASGQPVTQASVDVAMTAPKAALAKITAPVGGK